MQDTAKGPTMTIQSVRMVALEAAARAVKYSYRGENYLPPSLSNVADHTVALAKRFEDYIATGN